MWNLKDRDMTIQEMFDLLRDYRDSVSAVNNIRVAELSHLDDETMDALRREYHLALDVFSYLPKFTPMRCKHCIHQNCNRKRDKGVCAEYEVSGL